MSQLTLFSCLCLAIATARCRQLSGNIAGGRCMRSGDVLALHSNEDTNLAPREASPVTTEQAMFPAMSITWTYWASGPTYKKCP